MKKRDKKRVKKHMNQMFNRAIDDDILTKNEILLIREILVHAVDRYFKDSGFPPMAEENLESLMSQYQLALGDER